VGVVTNRIAVSSDTILCSCRTLSSGYFNPHTVGIISMFIGASVLGFSLTFGGFPGSGAIRSPPVLPIPCTI
jgi:hypothetical protein